MTSERSALAYDEAVERLVMLARASGSGLSAAWVEADATLSSERELVSAAARALAGGTNVFSSCDNDGREWFPYSSLQFTSSSARAGSSYSPRSAHPHEALTNRRCSACSMAA
jgi:hypothetical protein